MKLQKTNYKKRITENKSKKRAHRKHFTESNSQKKSQQKQVTDNKAEKIHKMTGHLFASYLQALDCSTQSI